MYIIRKGVYIAISFLVGLLAVSVNDLNIDLGKEQIFRHMQLEKIEGINPSVLIVGGGTSHDFDRWFNLKDVKTLTKAGAQVRYTDQPQNILPVLPDIDILFLSNNQPLSSPELHRAIFNFVESGNDLLLAHAAIWYNWKDWPAYNKKLVGGGSRGHRAYGAFEVQVVDSGHPLMMSVPATFKIKDELYRFQKDPEGSSIHVLAKAVEPETRNTYPIVWTVDYGKGEIVCMTLGHDKASHDHPAYKQILRNSIQWMATH